MPLSDPGAWSDSPDRKVAGSIRAASGDRRGEAQGSCGRRVANLGSRVPPGVALLERDLGSTPMAVAAPTSEGTVL
jgi:hypothetical protein